MEPSIKLSKALSTYWAHRIQAKPKQCWVNAMHVLMMDGAPWYVEGWAADPTMDYILVSHGWCELADGTIIDPTWGPKAAPGTVYLPTSRWSIDQLPGDGGTLPIVDNSREGRREHGETFRQLFDYVNGQTPETILSRQGRNEMAAVEALVVDEPRYQQPGETPIFQVVKKTRKRRKRPAPARPVRPAPAPREYPTYEKGELVTVRYMKQRYHAVVISHSAVVKGAYRLRRVDDEHVETVHPEFMTREATSDGKITD